MLVQSDKEHVSTLASSRNMASRDARVGPQKSEGLHKKIGFKGIAKICARRMPKKFPEIRLQAFSSKVSDGYRAQQKQRTSRLLGYEENITRLMEMNLATRPRAEQVLEMMQNDLDHAVDFLLAK